jgi:hypothetical protein
MWLGRTVSFVFGACAVDSDAGKSCNTVDMFCSFAGICQFRSV